MNCDLKINGRFIGTTSNKELEKQKVEADLLFKDFKIASQLIDSKDVGKHITCSKYFGGLFQKNVGTVNPAKLISEIYS